jgi:AcrR family transcriptional regulator
MSSTESKVTRKAPAERQAEIRAAAIALALEHGLDGVTQRRIAARVGVTAPLVSHYHSNMDALVAETFAAIVTAEIAELRGILGEAPTPTAAIRGYLDFLLTDDRDDVTVVWLDGWSRGRRNSALAEAVRAQMDAWQQFTKQLVDAGIAAGEFAVGDSQRAAWRMLGIIDGLNAHSLVRAEDHTSTRREVAALTESELGLAPGTLA